MNLTRFKKGDHVRVAKELGPHMSHFKADCDAIVVGSYAEQFGGENHDSYTIFIKGDGEHSWYYGHQLTLIESSRSDLLQEWEDERNAEIKQKSDIDWIFANGGAVAANPHGASIEALARMFGLDNLWGAAGEGINYYCNARGTMKLATPFLIAGDRAGWEAACVTIRECLQGDGP